MEEETLAANDAAAAAAPATDEEAEQRQRENERLTAKCRHQVGMLRAAVEELQGSYSTMESRIQELEGSNSTMESRIQELEGSVEQLVLQGSKSTMESRIQELEGSVKQLVGEKVLEKKVESLEREMGMLLEEDESELRKTKLALAELEEKMAVYEVKLENGNKAGADGASERAVGGGHGAVGAKFPWKMVVVSTGTVAAVTAVTCYLHHAKNRVQVQDVKSGVEDVHLTPLFRHQVPVMGFWPVVCCRRPGAGFTPSEA